METEGVWGVIETPLSQVIIFSMHGNLKKSWVVYLKPFSINEPQHEKTCLLHMWKQWCRSAAKLISAFILATYEGVSKSLCTNAISF